MKRPRGCCGAYWRSSGPRHGQPELVVHHPVGEAVQALPSAQQVHQMRCADRRRRLHRRQRGGGIPAQRAQRRDDREEHRRRELLGPQRRIPHAGQRAGAASARPQVRNGRGSRNLEDALPRDRSHRAGHQEGRDRMRAPGTGFALSRRRSERKGGGGVGAGVPPERGIHRSAGLRRERIEGRSRRREVYRRHPLHRDVRHQPAALSAGIQGRLHRQRHAGLREHGDGAPGGPHGLHPRRQCHGGRIIMARSTAQLFHQSPGGQIFHAQTS